MAVTREDIKEIQEVFDERYVKQSDCENSQQKLYGMLSNDDKRIELLVLQQKINNWLTIAIAGGIITLVIKIFLGG